MISPSRKTLATLFVLSLLVSCGQTETAPSHARHVDRTDVKTVEIVNLGAKIASADTLGDLAVMALVNDFRKPLTTLLKLNRVATSASTEALRKYASLRSVKMFQPEVDRIFPAMDSLSGTLTDVAGRMSTLFPGFRFPKVFTVVIPFNQSIIVEGDSVAYLGLNHYLGESHPAYNGFAGYVKSQKTPTRIPADIAEALIALSHPYKGTTVLSRLLYEGALVETVMQSTGMDEATVLGYDSEEYIWAQSNEASAWDALLHNKMLFSTDVSLADRLVAPAPSTSVLNVDSPGRLGRFIGHRIVSAYLDAHHDEAKAEFLLSGDFYNSPETLGASCYHN